LIVEEGYGAEGATTRETLRQKDRERYEILESGAEFFAPTDGVTCSRREISQVP
jgi:hypothetical protein